ncbi:hypothetical protein C8J57DRAFT_1478731 [Mycena rebaudengoi]|nr:hypothetical protein C8J57DRAFT_1478731 [Mycena rebaudengoi]
MYPGNWNLDAEQRKRGRMPESSPLVHSVFSGSAPAGSVLMLCKTGKGNKKRGTQLVRHRKRSEAWSLGKKNKKKDGTEFKSRRIKACESEKGLCLSIVPVGVDFSLSGGAATGSQAVRASQEFIGDKSVDVHAERISGRANIKLSYVRSAKQTWTIQENNRSTSDIDEDGASARKSHSSGDNERWTVAPSKSSYGSIPIGPVAGPGCSLVLKTEFEAEDKNRPKSSGIRVGLV